MSAATATGRWWRAWEWQVLFSYSSWSSGVMCFYICWWSHVASHPRWSRLLHLPGVPNMQIAMARCDSSTITVHEGIPIFVSRMKNQWHNLLMSDSWLVSRGISLSSAADFCCFKLQTAGVAMVLKWACLSVFSLLVPEPWTARPGRGNWVKLSRRWRDRPGSRSHCHPHHIFRWQPAPSPVLRAPSWPRRSLESDLGGSIVLSMSLSLNLLAGSMALWYEFEPGRC